MNVVPTYAPPKLPLEEASNTRQSKERNETLVKKKNFENDSPSYKKRRVADLDEEES